MQCLVRCNGVAIYSGALTGCFALAVDGGTDGGRKLSKRISGQVTLLCVTGLKVEAEILCTPYSGDTPVI